MEDVCSFVDDVQSIPNKLHRLEDIIADILKQIVECTIFIREYVGHGFAGVCQSIHVSVLALIRFYSQSCGADIFKYQPGHI